MDHAEGNRSRHAKPYARMKSSIPKRGNFYKAHNFTIRDSAFYDVLYGSESFMEKFVRKTITGAAFDSFERDPPPRCQPETRLAIVERALAFFGSQDCNKRLLWVVGPAGVGKSAIVQTIAEVSPTPEFTLGASLFFSINGRSDGSKAVATLAYQIAVISQPYRVFVQSELTNDPTLLDKTITSQFNKFFVEPFITHRIQPEGHKRFLILIDGLDECNDQRAQCTILDLILSFCIKYPAAPLVWAIASRPEPHITHSLTRPNVAFALLKEEIEVDSDQSCRDVEGFLREEFKNVWAKYPALARFQHWPAEYDFTKIAATAKGLFAYGAAVVKYVDDPIYANPVLRLLEVLDVIDHTSQIGGAENHPMANLDALYTRILSLLPTNTLDITKRLLLLLLWGPSYNDEYERLPFCCNWLGMTPDVAYGSLHHLHSLIVVPSIKDAQDRDFRFHHKSFCDYLKEFKRSGMFLDSKREANKLVVQCSTRVINEVSKGRHIGLDPPASISLSWPQQTVSECRGVKLDLYIEAINSVVFYYDRIAPCPSEDFISALRLINLEFFFERTWEDCLIETPERIFGNNLLPRLKELHLLREMPIKVLDVDRIIVEMKIIVHHETKHPTDSMPPFSGQCTKGHGDYDITFLDGGEDDGEIPQKWRRSFGGRWSCSGCFDYIQRDLKRRKAHSPEDLLLAFADNTGHRGWLYYTFPDSEDELSSWAYIIPYHFQ